jgi:alpha-L-rhamnosidase
MTDLPREPTRLRCEYLEDPLGIGTPRPRLYWEIDDDRPAAGQTGYRLLAASDPARLEGQEGDLWDTGFVESSESAHVVWDGATLGSRAAVWWKVRVRDRDGNLSPWSAAARFELGLLDRGDWRARWIAAPLHGAPRTSAVVPALRTVFRVPKPVLSARLYVTALGLYEISLNGQRVDDQELAPGWTDFRYRTRYQVYDVEPLLRDGENAIGALLGDGWYCGFMGLGQRETYGPRPALLAQLELAFADGDRSAFCTDESWRWHRSPILESDLLMGETVDARQDLGAWTEPGYEASGWLPVDVPEDPGVALDAMSGPPVRAVSELRPVGPPVRRGALLESPRWIFDLGQNMVGRVRLRLHGPRGATARLRHAEMLDEKGELYTENLREARQTDHFTLRGEEGAETFEPRFTFHGFRYVEVSGDLPEDAIEELTGVVLHSDLPATGEFECSNPLVNRLHENVAWGLRGNFVDVPTDCPQRSERLGWTGDAQVFVHTSTFHREVAGFFRKWLLDLSDGQSPEGAVPAVAPEVPLGRIRLTDGGPAWSDAMVICPWVVYRHYGDVRLLEERYDDMRRFVDHLERRFPSGIRSDPAIDPWGGFGDWLALDGTDPRDDRVGGTPKDLIGTAFFRHVAGLLSRMGGVLGRPDDEKRYADLSERVREAFRARFVTSDGRVTGNTQTSFVDRLRRHPLPAARPDRRRTSRPRLPAPAAHGVSVVALPRDGGSDDDLGAVGRLDRGTRVPQPRDEQLQPLRLRRGRRVALRDDGGARSPPRGRSRARRVEARTPPSAPPDRGRLLRPATDHLGTCAAAHGAGLLRDHLVDLRGPLLLRCTRPGRLRSHRRAPRRGSPRRRVRDPRVRASRRPCSLSGPR